MVELHESWYLKDPIDFEMRKYELLSFLKSTREFYNNLLLYPRKTQVHQRTEEIEKLIQLERTMFNHLKRRIVGVDFGKLELVRENPSMRREYLEELSKIIEYALPLLRELDREGKEFEGHIDSNSNLEPVGLESIYRNEGYLMISSGSASEIPVYRFRLGLLDIEKQPLIRFDYLKSFKRSVFETYESIKQKIIRQFVDLPNPATYVFVSANTYPLQATLLPVAKRKLVTFVID